MREVALCRILFGLQQSAWHTECLQKGTDKATSNLLVFEATTRDTTQSRLKEGDSLFVSCSTINSQQSTP